jgi:aromatic ring-cleaving dioxygenase
MSKDNDVHFYITTPRECHDYFNNDYMTGFKCNQTVYNFSKEQICIVLKNNVPVAIPPKPYSGGADKIIIRNSYTFVNLESIIGTLNNIAEYKKHFGNDNYEMNVIYSTLLSMYEKSRTNLGAFIQTTVGIDHEIPMRVVKENNNIYIPATDMLLQYRGSNVECPHPFSDNGMLIHQYRQISLEKKVSGVFVEVIDNENTTNARFMYAAGRVSEIPVIVDETKRSGVYISRSTSDKYNDVHVKSEYYTLEESDKTGLFKTREQAESGGDPGVLVKNEQKRLEQENFRLKQEHEKEQLKYKQELLESERLKTIEERKNKELQNELERLRAAREEAADIRKKARDDFYERESNSRRNSTELLKTFCACLVTGLTVFAAVKKSK